MTSIITLMLVVGLAAGSITIAAEDARASNGGNSKIENIQSKLEKQFQKFQGKMAKTIGKGDKKEAKGSTKAEVRKNQPLILEVGPSGSFYLRGFVEGNSTSTLQVRTWGGLWSVNVASTTVVRSKNNVIGDFKVGDYVGVKGKAATTSLSINATLLRDRTE